MGLPAVTIVGVVGLVWCLIMAYTNLAFPGFGLRGIPLYFALGLYVLLLGYYLLAKYYRKRQGIDITLAFKETPPP